jgi:hypothetical protein
VKNCIDANYTNNNKIGFFLKHLGEVDFVNYTAVFEYIAKVITDAFTEMCTLHRADPTTSIIPKRLENMARDEDAFLDFVMVVRVMLLKVLLLLVKLGRTIHILHASSLLAHACIHPML